MKKHIPLVLATLLMFVGSALLIYPDVGNLRNDIIQTGAIRAYDRYVSYLEQEQIAEHFHRAGEHNARLASLCPTRPFIIGYRAHIPEDYAQILNIQGVMAWIDIPSVDISLPIFHSSCQDVMEKGVGHIEGTSFPTGGYGTHSALTAHTGRPTARMFTDLRLVEIGDVFFISVLDRRLAYKVDQINIIWPHEIEWLRISPGEDLVTLITCTPYAINTHRLLVRGTRIPYIPDEQEIGPTFSMASISPRVYLVAAIFLLYVIMLRTMRLQKVTTGNEQEAEQIDESSSDT